MIMKTILSILFCLFLLASAEAKSKIKFATLAPEGSTWMKIMERFSKDVLKNTNGDVKFKFYWGGVQGDDEKVVIRKMRINQLQSAGFTGVGLGEILPEVRVLESPFLFKTTEEIDYINEKLYQRFYNGFEKKGYILLGWAEVGFVYVFTNKAVKTIEDFKGIKMWMWEGDPLAETTFRQFGMSPIPLSIANVLTSLQTHLIDGVYVPPLACLTLQWFSKVRYMVDVPLTNSIGAVLMTQKAFKKLSKEHQKTLREKAKIYLRELTVTSRKDNIEAVNEMLKAGIQKIKLDDPQIVERFERIGKEVRKELSGNLYDEALLKKVEKALAEYRKNGK
jgi:TRAP-type C4-dicarboxylate transport system substrate-binding protein